MALLNANKRRRLSRRFRPGGEAAGGTRPIRLCAAALALSIVTAACGGGGGTSAEPAAAGETGDDITATRVGAGIAAAAGDVGTLRPGIQCSAGVAANTEPITVAYLGVDLEALRDAGLETTVVDDPGYVIQAYAAELNANGGIHGRCIEVVTHRWDPADPSASFERICAEMPQQAPLVVLSLGISQAAFDCLAVDAEIPTVGIYASRPAIVFASAGGRLFADRGSDEHLQFTGLSIALGAGALTGDDRLGLLNVAADTAVAAATQFGLTLADTAIFPSTVGASGLSGDERQAELIEGDFADAEAQAIRLTDDQLTAEQASAIGAAEERFNKAAERFRDKDVTTVVTAAGWADVRRFMEAADLAGWYPRWIINDSHPASLVLTDAPQSQAGNVVQISASRAPGDEVLAMDTGCTGLRNTFPGAPSMSRRFHNDAWNLLTATCDYLDAVFAAITRMSGQLTRPAFVEALSDTRYETEAGSWIAYGRTDRFGNERYRVLSVDPNCTLNAWGCMRPTTDWLVPQQ